MKGYLLVAIVILLVFTGCASHYYRVRGGTIQIYLKRPDAKAVYFSSSLDGYERHKTKKIDAETWEVTLPANAEFKYFYVVDGVVYVPSCRLKESDGFGSENCIYVPGM
jgi:hypothetical protein